MCADTPSFYIFAHIWDLLKEVTGAAFRLSEPLSECIRETFNFYSGFRVQPGWHGDKSKSMGLRRICAVIRNRLFYPKKKRRILHQKLLLAFRERLHESRCDINVNIAAELCVLAVYIDVLNAVGTGFYSIETDGRSSKDRYRKPIQKEDFTRVLEDLDRI